MEFQGIYTSGRTALSFELFPPKTAAGERALYDHLTKLAVHRPDYVTCTYGAGGSTRAKTLEIVTEVKRRLNVPVAAHLTVVGSSCDELRDFLRQASRAKVDFIVALRGDPPQGQLHFTPAPDGLSYANELVELIRAEYPHFGIAVAGYPETHREALSADSDLQNLKRKVDAGANVVITQLFYNNRDFWRFRDRCQQLEINVPIAPGILPITSLSQVQRITALCGAKLPPNLVDQLGRKADADWQYQVGVEHAVRQVESLLAQGVDGLHFYVLNQSRATVEILRCVSWPNCGSAAVDCVA